MDSPFNDSPEYLNALRYSVKDWLKKAQEAVWSFHVSKNHSFLRDSTVWDRKKISLTTTARCYMALAYAEKQLEGYSDAPEGGWRREARSFFNSYKLKNIGEDIYEPPEINEKGEKQEDELNNFELAHLVDFFFLTNLNKRFPNTLNNQGKQEIWPGKLPPTVKDVIKSRLEKNLFLESAPTSEEANNIKGQVFFDKGKEPSKHFFVTLHTLRALAILNFSSPLKGEDKKKLTENAKQFCIKQFYYTERGLQHLQDPAGLAFAGSIYCMLETEIDRELILTFIETLAKCQQESGAWATTHPIIRKGQVPWYIASQELALALTWIYFQPQVPDSARLLLLKMLEKHFKNWVVPTFRMEKRNNSSKQFSGWYDDATAGQNKCVGWATGIVCHFLANYHAVLNDHINRRVIETLKLQVPAKRYLVDEEQPDRNPLWTERVKNQRIVCWPDLSPFSWPAEDKVIEDLPSQIAWKWTDPTVEAELSKNLEQKVLKPIRSNIQQYPTKNIAGILSGPSGTRKTSLVKAISEIINWPYIPVPASVIFDKGFDMMEARATEIFRNLNYLTQCVIFFDEFEDFFRDRKEGKDRKEGEIPDCSPVHNRTIAAFTTSAMLPRLQELRDQKRCLIFLATNHIGKIDEAIMRKGRFDYLEQITHPSIELFISDGESNYLNRLTKITLSKIGVDFDSDTRQPSNTDEGGKKLKIIASAVKMALKDEKVLKKIKSKKFQKKLGRPLNRQFVLFKKKKDVFRIKFTVIERALLAVSRNLSASINEEKLQKIAEREIISQVNEIIREEGPGSLSAQKDT